MRTIKLLKDDEKTYNIMIKDEIEEKDKITIKPEGRSLKVEIKEDDDKDLVYLGKQPVHPRERLWHLLKKTTTRKTIILSI